MNKSELFAHIMDVVSRETEVSSEDILSESKAVEVVDARSLLAISLYEAGFYPPVIARYMKKTPACIRYLIAGFEQRKNSNKILEISSQNVRKILKSN